MVNQQYLKNNSKDKKGLEVIGNPLVNKFLTSSLPGELHSAHYKYQAALGIVGILFIFFSFRMPFLFFAGAAILFARRHWRKKTDETAINYRNAMTSLKRKKYRDCIGHLDKLPLDHLSLHYLTLVKASCFLEMEDTQSAYRLYSDYFLKTPENIWSDPIYDSAQENAVILALENNNRALAKKIIGPHSFSGETAKTEARWKEEFWHLFSNSDN